MLLNENNYIATINEFSQEHWKPLLDLIPEIEKNTNFGKIHAGNKNKNGAIEMPYWEASPLVSAFLKIVYAMPVIIDFAWSSWDEGREMLNRKHFDFDSIDIPSKCKIITAIVRNDRFCEGTLFVAFSSGLILNVLTSIQRQLNAK